MVYVCVCLFVLIDHRTSLYLPNDDLHKSIKYFYWTDGLATWRLWSFEAMCISTSCHFMIKSCKCKVLHHGIQCPIWYWYVTNPWMRFVKCLLTGLLLSLSAFEVVKNVRMTSLSRQWRDNSLPQLLCMPSEPSLLRPPPFYLFNELTVVISNYC